MVDYKILAVDDDSAALEAVVDLLRGEGYDVHAASSGEEAEELLHRETYHLIVTDLVMPGMGGLELTRLVKENLPDTAVLLVTGHGSLEIAVEAWKAGAADYLTKPVDPSRLKGQIARILEGRPPYVPNRLLTEGKGVPFELDGMVARSPAMRAVFEKIELAASTNTSVLFRGETGSNTELCAESIHRRSSRARGPFVSLQLGAIGAARLLPELFGSGAARGWIEQAAGGTLFLDDIHELDGSSQAALLRLLETGRFQRSGESEEREVDVRVLAATTEDLVGRVSAGAFREDLFYRLGIFSIELPPLRQREDDIAPLVHTLLETFAARYRKPVPVLPDDTLGLLIRYPWPGNVRELRHVIEQAVILCEDGRIGPELLPRMIHREPDDAACIRIPIGMAMKEVEKTVIARTLEANRWNKNRTARILGISRRSLYNKLERYQIEREELQTAPANVATGLEGVLAKGQTTPVELPGEHVPPVLVHR